MDSQKSDAWDPKQYNKYQNERSQPFFDLVTFIQPESNMSVVDLGCGTGELTMVLHDLLNAKKTVGIDNSQSMLERAGEIKKSRLEFREADIKDIAEGSERWDVIFSNAALQWCPDHPTLFEKLKKVLKPGGQLAVQVPANHDYPTHVIANELSREEPYRSALKGQFRQVNVLDPAVYAEILFKLGFARQSVRVHVYGHVLETREDVIEWVKGTMLTHYESRLPHQVYEAFFEEFTERLFRQLPDEKPFFYPFKRILLWASLR